MGCRYPLLCYITFVVVSLLLYMGELTLHVLAAVRLYQMDEVVWFALLVGLLAVPAFTTQLVSHQWYGAGSDCAHQVTVALLHTVHLGIPWRYGRLVISSKVTNVDQEISHVTSLRVFLAFSSSLPVAILETYVIFESASLTDHPVLMAACIVAVISVCWTLASYRKRPRDYTYVVAILSWPGTLFKMLWRVGELTSRIIILALFTGLHTYWLFMVLGCHWITMLAWLLVEQMLKNDSKEKKCKAIPYAFLSSYMYVFSYLSIIDKKSKYRSVVFYFIMCLENVVLLTLWIIYDNRASLHVPVSVIVGSTYAASIIMCVIYYNCFHLKAFQSVKLDQHTGYIHTCINCRLSCCVKHDLIMQRPSLNAEWWTKKQGHLSDTKDTKTASEISSVSKSNLKAKVAPPGQYINPAFVYDNRRSYLDDTFSTVYTDSQYLSEFTVDSHYDTGSEFIWDDYDLKNRSAPDLIDATSTPNLTPEGAPIHQRSDSGFSASLSVQSDPKNLFTDYSMYTTDDSDFSYDPRYHRARLRAHWRRMSAEALNHMHTTAARGRYEDPSESDFFSQSSVSSMPQRRPKMYRDRKKLVMGRYSSGVHRTLQKRAERSRLSTGASDSDVSVPQRLSPRAITPDDSKRAVSPSSVTSKTNPKPTSQQNDSEPNKAICNQDTLDKIIADVSNIEISLSTPPPRPQMGVQMAQRRRGRSPHRSGGYTSTTDQSVLSDSPSTNSTTSLFATQHRGLQKTHPVWF